MRRSLLLLPMLLFVLCMSIPASAQEYIYQRDVKVPAYQTLREFFDMPNRPGHYEVSLFSDAIGPLTFRVIRIRGDHESILRRERSYKVGSHEFLQRFNNGDGTDDLMVEMANSNPAAPAIVSVYVIEIP